MMLLPECADFRTSHRHLTKIHQIEASGCALLKKEENNRPKGWTVASDSTEERQSPIGVMQYQVFLPLRSFLFLLSIVKV